MNHRDSEPGSACFSIQRCILPVRVLAILFFIPLTGLSQGIGVYAPLLGYGDALTMAGAASGISMDTGLSGGFRNPACYLVDRNELIIEGELWDAIAVQSGVETPDMRLSLGAVAYLVSTGAGTFVLSYVPRSRIQATADYPSEQINARLAYSRLEFGYALPLGERNSLGMTIGWIRGVYGTGVLRPGARDIETLYHPSLLAATFGYRHRFADWMIGAVLTSPEIGKVVSRIPAQIGLHRDEYTIDYEGAFGIRLGVGRALGNSYWDWDVSYQPASTVTHEESTLDGSSDLFESGLFGQLRIMPKIAARAGFRYRSASGDGGDSILLGVGGRYEVLNDLQLTGAMGYLLPVGSGYRNSPLDDVHPFVLRAGIMYHGE